MSYQITTTYYDYYKCDNCEFEWLVKKDQFRFDDLFCPRCKTSTKSSYALEKQDLMGYDDEHEKYLDVGC